MEDNNNYKIKDKSKRILLGVISVLLVIVLGACVWFAMSLAGKERALEAEREAREQAELNLDQALMDRDFDELNREFSSLENQRVSIMDDSVKRELTEKYEAAKLKVEKLQQELQNQKKKSAAEIKKLKDEISTLRALLRHYVEEINRLNQENQELRTEKRDYQERKHPSFKPSTGNLAQKRSAVRAHDPRREIERDRRKPHRAQQKRQKRKEGFESEAADGYFHHSAKQLHSRWREDNLHAPHLSLGPASRLGRHFSFEGGSVECSAKKTVEYAGEEIANIHIYWDVNTALSPGDYTVELFADNYRLARRSFSLK